MTEASSSPTSSPNDAQGQPVTNVYVNPQNPNALPPRSVGVAYVLWLLLGLIGVHRFYLGKVGTGILYLLTGGIIGIGWIIDAFTLASQVRRINQMRAAGIG